MALFNWGRRNTGDKLAAGTNSPIGFDLTSSRLLAARRKGAQIETLALDGDHPAALSLPVGMASRQLTFGQTALQLSRRNPHWLCKNYLPFLGQPVEWRSDWHRLTAESALTAWAERFRDLLAPPENCLWSLPSYLDEAAIRLVRSIFAKAKIVVNPGYLPELALVADRVHTLGQSEPTGSDGEFDSGLHGKKSKAEPVRQALVLILQADVHALSAGLVRIDHQEAKLAASLHLTKFGEQAWFNRLLDAISDRCVRLCRRDPRDSAEAEQMLFDQLEPMLDGVRFGRKVTVTVRAATWYQDLLLAEDDLALLAKPVLKSCLEALLDWLQRTIPREMPTEVWLRAEAGRLPGLATGLYQNLSEQTRVRILPADAVAAALVRLAAGDKPAPALRENEAIELAKATS